VATKKEAGGGAGRYLILRDCAIGLAGETVVLTDDDAADLMRDGMVAPDKEKKN
jgi:hypothetical protein